MGALNVVELCELAVPEESVASTTVDTLDVHAEGHDYLIVAIGAHIVLHTDLNCLIRYLNHLEVVLHLFLEKLMVENHDSASLDSAKNTVATTPCEVSDRLLARLYRWQG